MAPEMNFDLYVDTSRKGISIALAESKGTYLEIIDPMAKGETLSASLDSLLSQADATLDDVKRVMVTVGPGSFSGLRTGVAFCEGICFSGKRKLFGVTTLQALECFGEIHEKTAVVTRARNGYWYLRLDESESFIETSEVVEKIEKSNSVSSIKSIVVDESAAADETLKTLFNKIGVSVTLDVGKPLSCWAPLFDTVKPSLMQEANYIQPSYFEKLKA